MRLAYAIILPVLFLTACGSGAKLRRAERLIKKAEAQGATWRTDTIYKEIPIVVPAIKVDTVVERVNFADTITVINNRVVTKIKVDTVNKNVYVSTNCPEQNVVASVPVVVHRTIEAKTWIRWWYILIAFIAGYLLRAYFALGKV